MGPRCIYGNARLFLLIRHPLTYARLLQSMRFFFCRMWWTITGNFGNILPIDWSKSYARKLHMPALNLNEKVSRNKTIIWIWIFTFISFINKPLSLYAYVFTNMSCQNILRVYLHATVLILEHRHLKLFCLSCTKCQYKCVLLTEHM